MHRHVTSRSSATTSISVITLLVCLVTGLCLSRPAVALVIYDWHGVCIDGCTGTANATIILDDSYVPGTPFLCGGFSGAYRCPLIELTYNDSNFTRTFTNVNRDFLGFFDDGFFPAASGMQARIGLLYPSGGLLTFFWNPDTTWATTRPNTQGSSSIWALSLVPEPAPVALLGIALAGAALWRSRKASLY